MKRFSVITLLLAASFFVVSGAWAVNEPAISSNVNKIVAEIESGKDVTSIKPNDFSPYAFVMKPDGNMIVHPSLAGQSLKEKAPVVYNALMKASPEGVWVEYQWEGKIKHTYAQKTKNNLIVGSGY
jgi:hypothetical protein